MTTRLAAVTALAGIWLVLPATASLAHTRTAETTNVVSRVTHDTTGDGVDVVVYTGGLLIRITNTTTQTVHVAGYEGEPYLRIGPDGVHENARSPAGWLNRRRFGDVAIPPDVSASSPPAWRQVSDDPSWTWHDHRTHWMSPEPPPFVDAHAVARAAMRAELVGPIGRAGDQAGPFLAWAIPLMLDDAAVELHGVLEWVDAPGTGRPLTVAAVALAALMLAAWATGRDLVSRGAVAVMAVAALNTIHLVDDLVAFPSDPLDEIFGVLHTMFFLTLGLGGAAWARFASSGRVLALGLGSGAVLYHQGLVHLPMLYASQFPSIWPDGLVRVTIALGLLQALPVVVMVVRTLQSQRAAMMIAEFEPALLPAGGNDQQTSLDNSRIY